jgi:large subunit ribosomal protein L24
MKLKKGDQIKILSGKDRGRTGTVLRSLPGTDSLVVDGLNLFKKRSRPKKQGETGQTVMVARPFKASRAMLVCGSFTVVSALAEARIRSSGIKATAVTTPLWPRRMDCTP